VDESCGLLLPPPAGPKALAVALGGLIRDPNLRRRLGGAGPGRAARLCGPSVRMGQLRVLLRERLGLPLQANPAPEVPVGGDVG
jgi:hypothetical protein